MRRTMLDELFRMREEMDSLFENFFTESPKRSLLAGPDNSVAKMRKPLMDIYEEDNNYIVKADLPGYDKEDIKLNLKDGVLEIKAENKNENELEDKKKGTYNFERSYSGYYRKITLPENTDEEKIDAEYKNGVLKLKLPKIKEIKAKGKQIKIN